MTADQLLSLVTRAIDRRRREIEQDKGLRQVKIVLRRANGDWLVQIERLSEDAPS